MRYTDDEVDKLLGDELDLALAREAFEECPSISPKDFVESATSAWISKDGKWEFRRFSQNPVDFMFILGSLARDASSAWINIRYKGRIWRTEIFDRQVSVWGIGDDSMSGDDMPLSVCRTILKFYQKKHALEGF